MRIGMLGGMSWQSTAEYYRLANQLAQERFGGLHSADLAIASVDFADIEQLMSAGHWADLGALLSNRAAQLEADGADVVLLCANSVHKVADQIAAALSIPLLNLIDVTAAAVRAAGLTQVGLLGTRFVMEDDFYRDRMHRHGIELVVPAADARRQIHRMVFDELVRGELTDASRQFLHGTMAKLAEAGAAGVILGCTELELHLTGGDSTIPLFPTTRLHVHEAFSLA